MKREIEMTQAKIDQYGEINGDEDIIHYDDAYAKRRGFRGTLAHGPHLSGLAVNLAMEAHGQNFFYKGRLRTKWIAPVCPGDKLIVSLAEDGTLTEEVDGQPCVVGSAGLRDN